MSLWTKLIGSSVDVESGSWKSRRRSLCIRLLLWSTAVSILAFLIVSGWLGVLPGQWVCTPPPESKCDVFQGKSTPTTYSQAPSYKLALWHEGYPIATDGSNSKVFDEYVESLVEFCIAWKFSRCFLQLYNPSSTTTKAHTAFKPSSVAQKFVQPLVQVGIEAGFVAYARPKDTGWDRTDPLGDIAKYLQQVEAELTIPGHVCCLAFDHEDLGALAKDVGNKVMALKNKKGMWEGMQVGYAGGASLLSMEPTLEKGITDLYPELYWYGELAPGHETNGFFTCSTDCVTAMPCFSRSCVTTPYRKHVNDATGLVEQVVLPHLQQQGLGGSAGFDAASPSRQAGRVIWSMFSFEHLAGCCVERALGPQNTCGTFDGLALWDKKSVLELFEAVAQAGGFNSTTPMPIAVYEFQFIPPHLRDTSLPALPVLAESKSSASPLQCDGT